MGELAGLAGAGGVFGILATVIGLLLRAMHRDRQQYEDAIDRAEKRADAAEARAQAAWRAADAARELQHAAEDRRRQRDGGGP